MPLHASIHYNGWGAFPNPNGYTQLRVHVPWEGVYVRNTVELPGGAGRDGAVRRLPLPDRAAGRRLPRRRPGDGDPVLRAGEGRGVQAARTPRARTSPPRRVAAGASELRDEIILAWRASEHGKVGYSPALEVTDIEAGKVDPYDSLFGLD